MMINQKCLKVQRFLHFQIDLFFLGLASWSSGMIHSYKDWATKSKKESS